MMYTSDPHDTRVMSARMAIDFFMDSRTSDVLVYASEKCAFGGWLFIKSVHGVFTVECGWLFGEYGHNLTGPCWYLLLRYESSCAHNISPLCAFSFHWRCWKRFENSIQLCAYFVSCFNTCDVDIKAVPVSILLSCWTFVSKISWIVIVTRRGHFMCILLGRWWPIIIEHSLTNLSCQLGRILCLNVCRWTPSFNSANQSVLGLVILLLYNHPGLVNRHCISNPSDIRSLRSTCASAAYLAQGNFFLLRQYQNLRPGMRRGQGWELHSVCCEHLDHQHPVHFKYRWCHPALHAMLVEMCTDQIQDSKGNQVHSNRLKFQILFGGWLSILSLHGHA